MAKPLKAEFVHDTNADEYVVRLYDTSGGYSPVASCNGKLEAKIVTNCINAVLQGDSNPGLAGFGRSLIDSLSQ